MFLVLCPSSWIFWPCTQWWSPCEQHCCMLHVVW